MVHSDADQLVQDAAFTYSYDLEGRRISQTDRVSGEVTTFTYNALDQMVSLEQAGVAWSFAYSASDLRVLVRAEVGGVLQYGEAFVYDDNGLVRGTYDVSGETTAAYVTGFGFGEVLARVTADGAEYALRDRLGSTVGWLDEGGAVSEQIVRDAYGVRQAPMGVVPFGYTGHAEDPTGLVWGRARCYAPRTGAWTSEDPVWTERRYGYVGGAPLYNTDPTGEISALTHQILRTGIACALVAGVGASFGYQTTGDASGLLIGGIAGGYGCALGGVVAIGAGQTVVELAPFAAEIGTVSGGVFTAFFQAAMSLRDGVPE